MKKKIFSLLVGICLVFTGLFGFSGCSLVKEDQSKINSNVVMKIGNTELTRADVINAFYTYYNNNNSYFSYYDNAVIEESFYTWLTVKTLVEDMSFEDLYDEETNPDGYIYYTTEDEEEVWKALEDYFYSQISSYEKAIYTQEGFVEDNMPVWLQAEKADDADKKLETYKSPIDDVELKDRSQMVATKLEEKEVYSKVAALKERLFKYVVDTDDKGKETLGNIADVEKDYISGTRNQAYTNYMQTLILNAKANGNSTNEEDVLKKEVLRIYEAYYESQISVIFQNYYTQEVLLNYQGKGDASALGDAAIVKAFLKQYNTEKQTNQVEDAYVATITDTEKGSSLLMYHYGGENYYFTVQHILIKFSNYIDEQVKGLYGYSASGNYDEMISDAYIKARNEWAEKGRGAMLTPVNTDAQKDSIVVFGNYYYYDEDLKSSEADNYGYVKLSNYNYNEETKVLETDENGKIKHTFADSCADLDALKEKYPDEEIVYMATADDVLNTYNYNFKLWEKLAFEVYNGTKTVEAATEANKELEYVFETAAHMKEVYKDEQDATVGQTALRDKLASYLFIELEWVYSTDSLGNEISNKLGYVIASHPDDNGSWVSDFAIGARELVEANIDKNGVYSSGEVSAFTKTVVSDYGYHIMKVEEVYKSSSLVDLSGVTAEYDLSEGSDYVKQVVAALQKTYVCNTSNQTVYEYFRDSLYNTLVGTSQSSGTYFLAWEYKWLHELNEAGKIEMINKIDFDTLLGSLS